MFNLKLYPSPEQILHEPGSHGSQYFATLRCPSPNYNLHYNQKFLQIEGISVTLIKLALIKIFKTKSVFLP